MNQPAFDCRRSSWSLRSSRALVSCAALAFAATPVQAITLDWQQLSPASLMAERTQSSMAYDGSRDRLLVYGGSSGSFYYFDLWQWPLATGGPWTKVNTTGVPPDAFASIFYDGPKDRLVAFSGGMLMGRSFTGASSWVDLTPTGPSPAPRPGPAVAHDAQNQRLLIYGGGFVGSPRTDVWVGHLGSNPYFEQIQPAGAAPLAREGAGAVYDPDGDRLIVFGGHGLTVGANFSDVWALTLGEHPAWEQLDAAAPFSGSVRGVHDSRTGNLLVPDGGHVWAFPLGGGSWEAWDPSGIGPESRAGMALAIIPTRHEMALFGGIAIGASGAYVSDELWSTALPAPITGVEPPQAASGVALAVTPNPARGPVSGSFTLAAASPVRIEVVDLAGRRVAGRDLGELQAGAHRFDLSETRALHPGVYFLRMAHAGGNRTVRFVTLQ